MSVFVYVRFSFLKPDTENNVNFDSVSSKKANFDELHLKKKYIPVPKLIICGTPNL